MGSDESHFNISVGSFEQSHKTVSTNHGLFEEKGEPKRYRTEVLPFTNLPLGQTGSLVPSTWLISVHDHGHTGSPLEGWGCERCVSVCVCVTYGGSLVTLITLSSSFKTVRARRGWPSSCGDVHVRAVPFTKCQIRDEVWRVQCGWKYRQSRHEWLACGS